MASQEEIIKVRLLKLQKLESLGINAFPSRSNHTHTLREVESEFEKLDGEKVTVVGRVRSSRGQGAILFIDLFDGTGSFQVVLKKDEEISYSGIEVDSPFDLFVDTVDVGDFIECEGSLFVTKRGAHSVLLSSWRMLSKSLRALPDEHFGLQDVDEKFRKRYIDFLQNEELRELFVKKAKFWNVVRDYMSEKGFLEVETPTLEVTTGGAEATPFRTHHNDYDLDVFLRISIGELWQKRLMIGGFPKTFEIGRAYRNEGTSPEHGQEFTNLEFYWAYADYTDGMKLVQELYRKIAQEVFGTTKFTTRGHTFDLSDEWDEIDYVSKIEEMTGVNVINATEDDMKAKLQELGVVYEGDNKERLTDTLWKYCRKQISGPAFLVGHPTLTAPLSKESSQKGTVEKFQPILAGSEVGNGYSELNDPRSQRERFEIQQDLLASGDEEAMMPEWDFVEALEYGMPPACGFGFGERLFAFLADKPLRETHMFPLMKPKDE